jgi:hypothetical protein
VIPGTSTHLLTTHLSKEEKKSHGSQDNGGSSPHVDMNLASRSLLSRCQFTSPFLNDLLLSSSPSPSLPESLPFEELCGTFLKEYRNDTKLVPSHFESEKTKSLLSFMNAFPLLHTSASGGGHRHSLSKEEKKRRLTRRRSSLLMYRQSLVPGDQDMDAPHLPPQLVSDDDDDDDGSGGDGDGDGDGPLAEGLDFICNDDYGAGDDFGGGGGGGDEDSTSDDLFTFASPLTPHKPSVSGAAPATSSKIQWESVFTDPLAPPSASAADPSPEEAQESSQLLLPSVDWTQASYGYATLPSGQGDQSSQDLNSLALATQFTSLSLSNTSLPVFAPSSAVSVVTNSWAGASHWKSKLSNATRRKKEEETMAAPGVKGGAKGGKKAKEGKQKFHFDFDDAAAAAGGGGGGGVGVSELIDVTWESNKKKSKSRLDPRLLSETILKKQRRNARDLLLPEDQKIERRDIYRYPPPPPSPLFAFLMSPSSPPSLRLRLSQWDPLLVLPHFLSQGLPTTPPHPTSPSCLPPSLAEASRILLASLSPSEKLNPATFHRDHKDNDIIWGKLLPSRQAQSTPLGATAAGASYDSDGDDYGGGSGMMAYDDDGDDYDDFSPPALTTTSAPTLPAPSASASSGLEIEMSGGLLQAQRKVEKISIGSVSSSALSPSPLSPSPPPPQRYETTSKRVNVRKLKHDMWNVLEEKVSRHSNTGGYGRDSGDNNSSELSFQSLLSEMASSPSMRQQDASLSFYFISLLHLANEKVFLSPRVSSVLSDDDGSRTFALWITIA